MKVRDVDLNVSISGEGFTLIWGHGLMGSMAAEDSTGWFQWERMSECAKLIRYDARGHGKSGASYAPGDYRWKNLAGDMVAILDESGSDTYIAGGQSMGCATSIYAALATPQRTKALLLVNPPTAWETRADQASLYGKMALAARLLGGRTLARLVTMQPERLIPAWMVAELGDEVNSIGESIKTINGKTLATILRGAALCDLPPREELKKLAMPALILAWEGDRSHPVETAEELAGLMPESSLHVARDIYDFKTWPLLMREFVRSVVEMPGDDEG